VTGERSTRRDDTMRARRFSTERVPRVDEIVGKVGPTSQEKFAPYSGVISTLGKILPTYPEKTV
jgi:hypothetical protein